ncbi:MAG: peptidylprolyl isomerase [Oleiphilaceae bacterium]|nr:peptidylprolyl isomerase [Oleiphilaceae bacterium]
MADPRVVTIHYTLTNADGEVLDSSREREPLSYLEGAQNIISGLEDALAEKQQGDTAKVDVDPENGYGEVKEELIQPVPASAFEGVDKVEPGMQFQAQTPGGPQVVRVVSVEDEQVVIDANHPLAGQKLHFDVEVVETREPTEEEKEHGHSHDGANAHE